MNRINTIQLTLHHLGTSHRIQIGSGQYYSLMTLISDELAIPGFGLCCGMGSCGTCLIQLSEQADAKKRPVLACGIPVNDALANVHVFIPDKTY